MLRLLVLLTIAVVPQIVAAECLTIEQAAGQIGATRCVAGRVTNVGESPTGNLYLNFCSDYRQCPFSVFVPRRALRDVGDVRQLTGKLVEVHGQIRQYDGRAEIVLTHSRQLKGEAAKLPPIPKDFDVERKGHFSAGRSKPPKSQKSSSRKRPADTTAEEDVQ
jgi:hypothetical protein